MLKDVLKIEKPLERQSWLYAFDLGKIDTDYFIKRIDHFVKDETNQNYQTNVKGKMTNDIFLQDQNFINLLHVCKTYVGSFSRVWDYPWVLLNAWGVRNDYGDYTRNHRHGQACISGLIYLNSNEQELEFPELQTKVKPEPGRVVIWDSLLRHECKPNRSDISKYSVVFNIDYQAGYEHQDYRS